MARQPLSISRALLALILIFPLPGAAAAAPSTETGSPPEITAATRGLTRVAGLFDVYRDDAAGRVLMAVPLDETPFLLASSLPWGLGSNDVGLDRGQSGETRLVHFQRVGKRLFLIQQNPRFVANSADPDERRAATEAFAESVLWAGEILAEQAGPAASVLVDISPLLLLDLHGIGERLAQSGQGRYQIDAGRSAALPAQARSFPDNTELEALLTFAGAGEGEFVRAVAPSPTSLTVRQHLSLVRLPGPGFVPRRYHPGSGGFSTGYSDFARPLAASLDQRWQPRFRLEKTDPNAALSTVKKPIVFYLDRGTPEPVRQALLDGANGWQGAFEQAGFKDAFRVELLPPDVDPMDIRYNMIHWAHRQTRGWSYGAALIDPRSGEIIKGVVTLGSQRVRQDILIAETLLAPYAGGAAAGLAAEAEQAALARLRQLAAHEVGHALGFAHNFAASRQGNGSVMDYPHPLIAMDADGIHLNQAYGEGIGPWDRFLVAHAYTPFAPSEETEALARLRAAIAARGLRYVSDADARAAGDAEPDGLLWDFGADALPAFAHILAVRRSALARFGQGVLPADRQSGELEARLVPLYLLHRYQTEAVARLIAGVHYDSALAGADYPAPTPVAAGRQRQAFQAVLATLSAEHLALPASVLDRLTPPAADYARDRDYFATAMAPLFDPLAAAEAATANTSQFLFAPARLNRLAWQHARDPEQPGLGELLDAVFKASWQRGPLPDTLVAGSAVQLAANWTVLDRLLAVLDDNRLHAQVAAELRQALAGWQRQLGERPRRGGDPVVAASRAEAAALIARYLADPATVRRPAAAVIPPGAPI
ncbi:MAG: zinc-dependent metalloprotease [Lysobacterales bacterium]